MMNRESDDSQKERSDSRDLLLGRVTGTGASRTSGGRPPGATDSAMLRELLAQARALLERSARAERYLDETHAALSHVSQAVESTVRDAVDALCAPVASEAVMPQILSRLESIEAGQPAFEANVAGLRQELMNHGARIEHLARTLETRPGPETASTSPAVDERLDQIFRGLNDLSARLEAIEHPSVPQSSGPTGTVPMIRPNHLGDKVPAAVACIAKAPESEQDAFGWSAGELADMQKRMGMVRVVLDQTLSRRGREMAEDRLQRKMERRRVGPVMTWGLVYLAGIAVFALLTWFESRSFPFARFSAWIWSWLPGGP